MLNSPLKFERIVEANSKSVFAQASDGNLYYFSSNCYEEPVCNQWVKIQVVPDYIHVWNELPIERGISCQFADDFKYLRNPPGNIIECVRAWFVGVDIMPGWIVYYALLDG
jgi:hypothetical protein